MQRVEYDDLTILKFHVRYFSLQRIQAIGFERSKLVIFWN